MECDRLSHLDRDTLIAVLSSREAISEPDAKRINDQIEGVRRERSPSEYLGAKIKNLILVLCARGVKSGNYIFR